MSASANRERTRQRYERSIEELAARGLFDEKVWPHGCGRCGGDFHVQSFPIPFDALERKTVAVQSRDMRWCNVCRVDRVKVWGALLNASAAEGNELRTLPPAPHRPYARALEAEGFVRYNNQDGAWELTDAGLALLRRHEVGASP